MRRKSRPPPQPRAIQVAYWGHLRKLVRRVKALVEVKLLPLLPALMERATPAAYADALPPGKRVNHLIEAIKKQVAKDQSQDRLERITKQVGKLVSDHNLRILDKQKIEVNPLRGTTKAINAFTSENVALIRSISADYLGEVEAEIHRAMGAGQRHEGLADRLEERFSVAESRAKLIARDQVLKFQGSLNATRQQAAGVEKYVWRSVEDERVRGVHEDFDGNTYSWDDPPGDGSPEEGSHPGTAVNCRCWAEGVIPEFEE